MNLVSLNDRIPEYLKHWNEYVKTCEDIESRNEFYPRRAMDTQGMLCDGQWCRLLHFPPLVDVKPLTFRLFENLVDKLLHFSRVMGPPELRQENAFCLLFSRKMVDFATYFVLQLV